MSIIKLLWGSEYKKLKNFCLLRCSFSHPIKFCKTQILGIGLKDPWPLLTLRTLLATNSTQLGNHRLEQLRYWKPKASIQNNTEQTADIEYTIEDKHKLPKRVILITVTTSRSDHIQEKMLKVKTGVVLIKSCYFWIERSRTIVSLWKKLVQTENNSCSLEKIRYILVRERNWLWALIRKSRVIVTEIQGVFTEILLFKYLMFDRTDKCTKIKYNQ